MSSLQGKSDRKKSILKQRDPETEHLISNSISDSPQRKPKAPPVKFIGVAKDDDDKSPRRKLPCSPIPSRKVPRAPLADLFADFDAPPENGGNSDEKQRMNDAFLDQQNANTALRCSRQNCKLNSPAQNSSIIQDPLIAPFYIPLCICGAPMTRIPVQPSSNDNEPFSNNMDPFKCSNALSSNVNTSTDQVVALTSTEGRNGPEDDDKNSAWKIPVSRSSQNGGYPNRQNARDVGQCNLNEEDQMLSTVSTPTEETKLIDELPLPRVSDKISK